MNTLGITCVICGDDIPDEREGHIPAPLFQEGMCCEKCNMDFITPFRGNFLDPSFFIENVKAAGLPTPTTKEIHDDLFATAHMIIGLCRVHNFDYRNDPEYQPPLYGMPDHWFLEKMQQFMGDIGVEGMDLIKEFEEFKTNGPIPSVEINDSSSFNFPEDMR